MSIQCCVFVVRSVIVCSQGKRFKKGVSEGHASPPLWLKDVYKGASKAWVSGKTITCMVDFKGHQKSLTSLPALSPPHIDASNFTWAYSGWSIAIIKKHVILVPVPIQLLTPLYEWVSQRLSFPTTEAKLGLLWEEGWVGMRAVTCPIHIWLGHLGPGSLCIIGILLCISSAPQRLPDPQQEPWRPLQELFLAAGWGLNPRRALCLGGMAMVLAEAAERWPSGWGPRAGAASLQARATFPGPLPCNPRGCILLSGRWGTFGLPWRSWLLRRRTDQEVEDKCADPKGKRWSPEGNQWFVDMISCVYKK